MNLALRVVDTNYVQQAWPKVVGFIEEAQKQGHNFPEWSKSYTIEHIRMYLTTGQWLLIVIVDEENQVHGSITVSFINTPLHRIAFITSIGGKLIANKDTFDQLKAILKELGATKIQGYGRDAIVRLWKRFDFEPRNTLVEVLL